MVVALATWCTPSTGRSASVSSGVGADAVAVLTQSKGKTSPVEERQRITLDQDAVVVLGDRHWTPAGGGGHVSRP